MKYLADLVCDTLEITISMFSDSIFILRKSNDKSDFAFYANYRRFASSSEFLLVYDVDQNYEGYWKAQDNNVYYIRFVPKIMEHDRPTLFRKHYITDFNLYCCSIGFVDVDKNGLEEIYIVDTEKHNLLLSPKKVGAATSAAENLFIDRAEQFNIQASVRTRDQKMIFDHGISFADVDNDGDEDGYLTSLHHSNLYFENISGKIFHEKSKQAGISGGEYRSIVGVWADVNNDGLVDLFVANEDTTNMLFLNKGGNNFVDVTAESGLLSDERGNGAYFGDLDLDGDLDLVVTFHNYQPRIYRNDTDPAFPWQVRFSDVTDDWLNCDVDSNAKNTGCFLADYDNDGDLDLFICYQIFSNRLFQNDGTGRFRDVTQQAGLIDSNLTCAAIFFDADNDGDLDLYVANREQDVFYENLGNGTFRVNSHYFGSFGYSNSTNVSFADIDNDGDIDCFVSGGRGPVIYFENRLDNLNFIKIKPVGVKSNRSAIGAKTLLYRAGHLDEKEHLLGLREVSSGNGLGGMPSRSITALMSIKNMICALFFPQE
ncbi:MAG TPA: VCBS repeat-containing protein [bacterium]|nr:VCBS repeat-containing protein [bacterium]